MSCTVLVALVIVYVLGMYLWITKISEEYLRKFIKVPESLEEKVDWYLENYSLSPRFNWEVVRFIIRNDERKQCEGFKETENRRQFQGDLS